jgi:hypothetical protein
MVSAGLGLVLISFRFGFFSAFVFTCRLLLPHTFWKTKLCFYSLPLPVILLIVNTYLTTYSPPSHFSNGCDQFLDCPFISTGGVFHNFSTYLGVVVLALTSLGMAVPASLPFWMILASTTHLLGMLAPALMPLVMVVLALTPI